MEESGTQYAKLVHDIKLEAEEEAKEILEEARRFAEERRQSFEQQIAEIEEGAKKTAAEQVRLLTKSLKASLAVELRRIILKNRDEAMKKILAGVKEKLAARIREKDYPGILCGWIVEAAIGLDAPNVLANASPAELALIDEALLKKAKEKVKALAKKNIEIAKSDLPPLARQGVIVVSRDGKTAFNNQVETRLIRQQSAIRKIIYSRLFDDVKEPG
jgi:vacuolar-type H+-ATPase subunit E/Vma4